ncbi:MAG: hypothetical protein HWE10_01355 [Gammaproteobacteria bacterium]|nr:hypothetical protein [Gammaproteobacteria bacterium]
MKCFIRSNNVKLSKKVRSAMVEQISKTFDRLQDKIQYVVVSFQDVNGNKGGIDKQCSIKVVGYDPVDVQVHNTKENIHSALYEGLSKAQFTFTSKAKKLASKLRKRQSVAKYQNVPLTPEPQM